MTIPVSTVPLARAAIVSQTVTALADTTVLVVNGEPGPNQPADIIAVTGVDRQVTASALVGTMGAHSTAESYTVYVVCSSYRGGDGMADVNARVWVLVAAVETAVRTDPTLGGVLNISARPGVSRSEGPVWDDDHKGVIEEVTVAITCQAQI